MCRPKGRRCPGQKTPEHRAEVNAKRRARYAANKNSGTEVNGSLKESSNIPSLSSVLPGTTGVEMAKFEFKSRLPKKWNPKKFKPVTNGFIPGYNGAQEKPIGGLWSSPIERDEDMEVSEWDNMYQIDPAKATSINHDVTFSDDAKVLIVDNRADYDRLLKECGHTVNVRKGGSESEGTTQKTAVDYEKLSGSFDAVYFTSSAVYANGRSNPNDEYFDSNVSLRNLDIASLYIMNPKAVTVIPE